MKILHLDIETAPNVVHVWGLWKQDVSIKQVLDSSYTLCWAAKWDKKKPILFSSVREERPKKMIERIHALIDEADAIVHFNGNRFDMPTLNKEFLLHGIGPPSPYKNIDLYSACKSQFRLPSFKLEYIANNYLGLGAKLNHKGHQLWIDCMGGSGVSQDAYEKAWRIMKRYNKQDVVLNERVYQAVLPWIKSHPNYNVYNDDARPVCSHCGRSRVHKTGGWVYTATQKYHRYRCAGCGKWLQGRRTALSKETRKTMLKAAN